MKVGLFYLPSVGPREEMLKGMAGNRPELYQNMLSDLGDQARLADELGYDGIAFTEHHFHIEGFELSNNPVLLGLFVGAQTKRIRVGQLGVVLPATNPLRVAEDIAMLDHMTGGRAFAGFARGYQRRWVDTMAQHYHNVHATGSDQSEVDRVNREAFEEFYRIIKLAWTKDTFHFEGKFWRIPAEGTPWPIEATQTMGSGVDKDGVLREIGVVPKPLQKPHPPLMQPFAFSESTIRWCAAENVMPVLAPANSVLEQELFDTYQDEAAKQGRTVRLGEQMALLRDEEGPLPPDQMFERSLALVGSVDSVTRQLERLMARLPVEYLMAWQYVGLIPNDKVLRSLELFATKVLPRVGVTLNDEPSR